MNALMTNLLVWLRWGCERVESHTLQRKIFHVNVAALIALVSMAIFAVLDVVVHNPALIRAVQLQLPFYFIIATVPWLNRRGHAAMARWTISLSITAAVAFNVWLVNGSWLQLHFFFLLFAVAAVALFPLQQWRSIVFLFGLNGALFAYCEYVGVEPDALLLMLDTGTVMMFRTLAVAISLFSVLFITWLGEHVASRNERELEDLSGMDTLTRLPNRRRMEQRLAEAIAAAKRNAQRGAVMFLDLDNFKPLNDGYGHAAGDALLQEVAQRIAGCIRAMDMVARFGGDEFVILLPELGVGPEEARKHAAVVAEKIRARLAEPYHIGVISDHGKCGVVEHRCTASIGVEMFAGGTMSASDIIKRADAAMYQAKESGRNAIVYQEESPHVWENPELPMPS